MDIGTLTVWELSRKRGGRWENVPWNFAPSRPR